MQICSTQVRAYVAREKARRAQRARQHQQPHHQRASPEREATSITEAVRDSLTAALFRADNASEASDSDTATADTDSSSSSACEDASAGPAETFVRETKTQDIPAGGVHGGLEQLPAPLPPPGPAQAEGPAPLPPADAAAVPPNEEPAVPAARAGDEDDLMDVPFEELIGLRGPWRQLFENAATVLASTFVFLLAMLWVPFMLGSFTMAAVTRARPPPVGCMPCPLPTPTLAVCLCTQVRCSSPQHVLL